VVEVVVVLVVGLRVLVTVLLSHVGLLHEIRYGSAH
jgi:hypothetical protein